MPKGKPNILILWGDDIGYWNDSAYNLGMMAYKKPQHRRHLATSGRSGARIATDKGMQRPAVPAGSSN
jgi:arylsulfatase A-like enzyme